MKSVQKLRRAIFSVLCVPYPAFTSYLLKIIDASIQRASMPTPTEPKSLHSTKSAPSAFSSAKGDPPPPPPPPLQFADLGKKTAQARRTIKLCGLVACWLLVTVSLLLHMERKDVVLNTAVLGGVDKEHELPSSEGQVKALIKLRGPFLETHINDSVNTLQVWLHREAIDKAEGKFQQNSKKWEIFLQPDDLLDFSPSVSEKKILILQENSPINRIVYNRKLRKRLMHAKILSWKEIGIKGSKLQLCMRTSSGRPVPLIVSYQLDPVDPHHGVIYALILLITMYILIIFEIINRTIAALLTSSLAVAELALCGTRPSLMELVSWLDVETLLLLFSMMVLVSIVAGTGLFDYIAVLAFQLTKGRTWPLINALCFLTAIISAFMDNVTTILLMTPVTIRLSEVTNLNPIPVLMSIVIFSNIVGGSSPVGEPSNVIVSSHPAIIAANLNFMSFLTHLGPGILFVSLQTYLQVRFMFRDVKKLKHKVPRYIAELRKEIAVWNRAADSLDVYTRDEEAVRTELQKKIEQLNLELTQKETMVGAPIPESPFSDTLEQLKKKYRIKDKTLLVKSIICVAFVVIVFFLHVFPAFKRLSLGWTAFLGALLLLLLAEREDVGPILARVEWSTLLFFAALFVLMEALSELGLISWIGNMTEMLILHVKQESRLAVSILLILWVSGVASAFLDNIPLASVMVRVIVDLADPAGLGLPLAPLTWALSLGTCLGGNGTLIGSSANVICAGVAEQHGYRFTFVQFFKIGFPIMLGHLTVASMYLLICHCVFKFH